MDNLEQTYREAVAAVREKDFYRGRGLLKEVLRQDPTHVMAHLWYARATDELSHMNFRYVPLHNITL